MKIFYSQVTLTENYAFFYVLLYFNNDLKITNLLRNGRKDKLLNAAVALSLAQKRVRSRYGGVDGGEGGGACVCFF